MLVARTYIIRFVKGLGFVVLLYKNDVDIDRPLYNAYDPPHYLDCRDGWFYGLTIDRKVVFMDIDSARKALDEHIKRFNIKDYKILENLEDYDLEDLIGDDEFLI